MKRILIIIMCALCFCCITAPDIVVIKSDDGEFILYVKGGVENLYIIDATTGEKTAITE